MSIKGWMDFLMWCIHTMEYYLSLWKERNLAIYDNMDELGDTMLWNKTVIKEKYCMLLLTWGV